MKNVFKVLGVIALVAVIGFGVVSCGGDDDKGGNNNNGGDNNNGGQTGGGKTVLSIRLNTSSVKKDYSRGDALDLTGLVVTVRDSDYEDTEITTGFTSDPAAGTVLNTTGKTTVTITYGGKSSTFDITVKIATASVAITNVDMKGSESSWNLAVTLTLSGDGAAWNDSDFPDSSSVRWWFNPPITTGYTGNIATAWDGDSNATGTWSRTINRVSDTVITVTFRYSYYLPNLTAVTVNLRPAGLASMVYYTNVRTLTEGTPSNNTDNNVSSTGH